MELLLNRNISEVFKKMLICIFAIGIASATHIVAQQTMYLPDLPVLGFGISESCVYRNDIEADIWWPDHRIWSVPSRLLQNSEIQYQEILVPVFIENRWYNFNKVEGVVFQEISSFSFRVYYDDRALEFLDLQKHHPFTQEEAENLQTTHFYTFSMADYYQPLAYNFNLVASNKKATDFYKYFDINDVNYTPHGSTVTISGTASSFRNLPTTEAFAPKVLLYLKFKVIPHTGSPTNAYRASKLYFDPTYICYNGVNITKSKGSDLLETFPVSQVAPYYNNYKSAFRNWSIIDQVNNNMQYFNPNWSSNEKDNQVVKKSVGIQKYNNYENDPEGKKYAASPYLPGSIDVQIMADYPEFLFSTYNDYGSVKAPEETIVRDNDDPSKWILTEPITADSLGFRPASYQNRSERCIVVSTTGPQFHTMENIIVESDQNWLKFRAVPHNNQAFNNLYENKFSGNITGLQPTRRAFAQRINQLITPDGSYNPFPCDLPLTPKQFFLFIDCDQSGLGAGEYIGHISFKSPFDKWDNTTIQVRFIVLENPVEIITPLPPNPTNIITKGITLEITPFNGTRDSLTRTLIMGSSPFATDQVDSLLGEYPRKEGLGFNRYGNSMDFDARFFLDSNVYKRADSKNLAEWMLLTTNGFGDYTHFDGLMNSGSFAASNKTPRSNSRDIRTSLPSNQSNIHYVKFKYREANVDFYPVVLKWNTRQFPNANSIHLKYLVGGKEMICDMRTEGTDIGNGQRTFSFFDKNLTEFWIEYTVGQESEANYVDNFGDAIIQPNAWNFVSLPLDPVNKFYKFIYPNALNVPYYFYLNNWINPVNGVLQPGEGYFVKYQNLVDKKFYGAYINQIDPNNYPVRLSSGFSGPDKGGWNAIGSLSKVISVNNVSFASFQGGQMADQEFTQNAGFWAYKPNEGYKEVVQIFPGKAYFIKVNRNAYLQMSTKKSTFELPPALNNKTKGFDKIVIVDAEQRNSAIYAGNNININNFELPPMPPSGMFDVRYQRNNYVTNYGKEDIVNMQGISYPVSVLFENPRANYTISDPVSGEIYGTVKAGNTGNVIINYSKSNSFKLLAEGSDVTFFVNVNNNPIISNTAEINFGIDNDAMVDLKIYNSFGVVVSNIEPQLLNKGIYNKNIDITNLPSGSYTIKLSANGENRLFMMNVIK